MKKHDSERIRVLVVDDHPIYLRCVRELLGKDFLAVGAENSKQAERLFRPGRFDCVLSDVVLGRDESGIDLAKKFRKADPDVAIILNSANPDIFFGKGRMPADICLEKTGSMGFIKLAIQKVVSMRRMPYEAQLRQLSSLYGLLGCQKSIKFIQMAGDSSGALRMEGQTRGREPIAWVTYVDPSLDVSRAVIGLASCIGCPFSCDFCGSGPFKRVLSKEEMLAQFFYSLLFSYHTMDVFDPEKHVNLTVNWTCMGDCVCQNLDNTCATIETLSGLRNLDLDFIMTTRGDYKNLMRFLKEKIHLPVSFYLSTHFRPEMRSMFMGGPSIDGSLDALAQISAKTGRMTTIAWHIVAGLNNLPDDIAYIKEICRDRPFEVKVAAMRTEFFKSHGMPLGCRGATDSDVHQFAEQLITEGIPCRERKLLGFVKNTCGLTMPTNLAMIRKQRMSK